MSRSEKRYFKLQANRSAPQNDQNYLLLFQAIDKMKVYDEVALIKGLNNPKLKRQLPVLKNYLYNLILKSLREFKTNHTLNFQIKELLTNVDILIKRNLIHQAKKQLEKAGRLIHEYERIEYTPELIHLKMEVSLLRQNEKLKKSMQEVDNLLEQTQLLQNRLSTFNSLRGLSWKLMLLNRTETYARSPKVKSAYEAIARHPLLISPPPTDSIRQSVLYFQCKGIIHLAFREYHKSLHFFIALSNLMEANLWSINQSPSLYVHTLQNSIQVAKHILLPEQLQTVLDKLTSFHLNYPKAKLSAGFILIAHLFELRIRLESSIGGGNDQQTETLAKELKQLLDQVEDEVDINAGFSILEVYACLAHFHIARQEWTKSLGYLQLIHDQRVVHKEYEIYLDTQLLRVIVLFELREMDLFETEMDNLYRSLKGKERLFAFEKAIFNYLRKRMRLSPEDTLEPWVRKLKEDMVSITQDPNESMGLYPFDVIGWLEKTLESGRV